MKNKTALLRDFRNRGVKHHFQTISGKSYQGWIHEIKDERLSFADSGPLAEEELLFVPLSEINLETLSYWNERKSCWIEARGNPVSEKWQHFRARPL